MGSRALVLAVLALTAAPASADANGDPASDVLLQAKIYFPTQRVGVPQARALHTVVDSANARGYTIRVALIKDATDLGTVPNLLNQAQRYAEFLGPEIRFVYKGDLLVVMPKGVGLTTTDQTPPPRKALAGMKVEGAGSPNALAQTAGEAVTKLAAAAGHPLASTKKGGSGAAVAGAIAVVALLAAAVAGAFWLRRGAPRAP